MRMRVVWADFSLLFSNWCDIILQGTGGSILHGQLIKIKL